MFQSITFYIGGKTLGIYGEEFPLGALTTEVLNISPENIKRLTAACNLQWKVWRVMKKHTR